MSERGRLPMHCFASFHTVSPDQSASFILLLLISVALPNVPPRSLITSHGEPQVSLPLASFCRPAVQTISC